MKPKGYGRQFTSRLESMAIDLLYGMVSSGGKIMSLAVGDRPCLGTVYEFVQRDGGVFKSGNMSIGD